MLEQVTFAQGGMSGKMQDACSQPTLPYQNTPATAGQAHVGSEEGVGCAGMIRPLPAPGPRGFGSPQSMGLKFIFLDFNDLFDCNIRNYMKSSQFREEFYNVN